MNAPLSLAQVLPTWMQAKEDERKAIEHRRSLDKMIQDLLPKRDEGSITQSQGDYKVTVTYKMTRSLDTEQLQQHWHQIPERAHSAIKWKADLSTSSFRSLSPEDAALIGQYMTTKPASPTVSVELKEQ